MASNIRNIWTKMLIFLFCLSFTNATPEEDMVECIKNVREICKTKRNHPPARICIQNMMKFWRVGIVPSGPIRIYYFDLKSQMNQGAVPLRGTYCSESFPDEIKDCKNALKDFGDDGEDVLIHVLYDSTWETNMANRFTYSYMEHLVAIVPQLLGNVMPPWIYCKKKCFPRHTGIFNWARYEQSDGAEDEGSTSADAGAAAVA